MIYRGPGSPPTSPGYQCNPAHLASLQPAGEVCSSEIRLHCPETWMKDWMEKLLNSSAGNSSLKNPRKFPTYNVD